MRGIDHVELAPLYERFSGAGRIDIEVCSVEIVHQRLELIIVKVDDQVGMGRSRSTVMTGRQRTRNHVRNIEAFEHANDDVERLFLGRHGSTSARSGHIARASASPRRRRANACWTWASV